MSGRSPVPATRALGAAVLIGLCLAVLLVGALGGAGRSPDRRDADRPGPADPVAAASPASQQARAALGAPPLESMALVPDGWRIGRADPGRVVLEADGSARSIILTAGQADPDWLAYVAAVDAARRPAPLPTVTVPDATGGRVAIQSVAAGRPVLSIRLDGNWILTAQLPPGSTDADCIDLAAQIIAPAP